MARRHAREAYEEYDEQARHLKERAQTQRNWMAQGVRNARRKSTDNDKIGRNKRVETSEKQAAKARQTERAIERLEVVEEPRKEWELRMTIAAAPRSGTVVASARGVVRRGSFTLGPVDAQVDWADRVAITGPNGSGKTTLLGALLGRIPVDEGVAGLGSGVRVGEIDQARGLFLGPDPLARAFGGRDARLGRVRRAHAAGQVRADAPTTSTRPAGSLSPGERTRAALALLQARGVNLLVLDEPTNHLDLAAIEQLEAGAGQLRRHGAARDARPADARHGAHHPPVGARRRAAHRALRAEMHLSGVRARRNPAHVHLVGPAGARATAQNASATTTPTSVRASPRSMIPSGRNCHHGTPLNGRSTTPDRIAPSHARAVIASQRGQAAPSRPRVATNVATGSARNATRLA